MKKIMYICTYVCMSIISYLEALISCIFNNDDAKFHVEYSRSYIHNLHMLKSARRDKEREICINFSSYFPTTSRHANALVTSAFTFIFMYICTDNIIFLPSFILLLLLLLALFQNATSNSFPSFLSSPHHHPFPCKRKTKHFTLLSLFFLLSNLLTSMITVKYIHTET